MRYLGFIVQKEGLRVDPNKVRPVQEYPPPKNLKQLHRDDVLVQTLHPTICHVSNTTHRFDIGECSLAVDGRKAKSL